MPDNRNMNKGKNDPGRRANGRPPARTQPKDGQNLRVIKGKKKKNKRLSAIRAIISAVVIFALIITVVFLNSKSPGGIVEWTQTAWASLGQGGGYPITDSGRGIKSVYMQGSNVLAFTNTSLVTYNKNGKQIRNVLHGYTTPAICATESRTLIYDRGAMTFRVDNNNKTLFEKKTDNAIITADMAENGAFALVMEATGYLAQVKVFSKDFIEKSTRYFSSEDVAAVTVCKDAKHIVVVTVTAVDGYYRSTVSKYDFKSDNPVHSASFDGVLILDAAELSSGDLFLIGDSKCIITGEDISGPHEISYGGSRLAGFDVYGAQAAVILENTDLSYDVAVISKDGSEIVRKTFDTEVMAVLRRKGRTFVLKKGYVECFDDTGNIINKYECSEDAVSFTSTTGKNIAVASASEIGLIPVK